MAVLRKVRTVGSPWMDMMRRCTPGGEKETTPERPQTDRYNISMKRADARGGNRTDVADRRKDASMDENSDATKFREIEKRIDGIQACN